MQKPVFVFDLDGVITDPKDTSVDTVVVERIHKLLEDGTYVAVNTGRSYKWVEANLLKLLRSWGGHTLFNQLYIVGEKGGESLIWNGDDFAPQPSRFALPKEAVETCKRIFDENAPQFSTMFWDATKLTMASIEKYPEADIAEFHVQQEILVRELEKVFAGQDVKVEATISATDAELPGAGKHAGAELIYEWMALHTDVEHVSLICFGDSKSDYEMARYFASQGNETTFVFVGKKDTVLEEHGDIKLIRPTATFSAGTREYFLNYLK